MDEIGPFHAFHPEASLPYEVWQKALQAKNSAQALARPIPPAEVLLLAENRQLARQNGDWTRADEIRKQAEDLGWKILDTRDGPEINKLT
jgi:cysteinyl-tRNA synthetase